VSPPNNPRSPDNDKTQQLVKETRLFVSHWLDAAEKLPTTARRSKDNPVSKPWLAAARCELEPVDHSWVQLCHLLGVLVRLMRYFKDGATVKTTRDLLKKPGVFCTVSVLVCRNVGQTYW
jgi:hypothetical protein